MPRRALVDFQRVSIAASGAAKVRFAIPEEALRLVDENGEPRLYAGEHSFVATRGHGPESVFNLTIPVTQH